MACCARVQAQRKVSRVCNVLIMLKDEDSGEDREEIEQIIDKESLEDPHQIVWPKVKCKPGEHQLQYSYCLWFSRRTPGNKASSANYEQNIKIIGAFASVEQFWTLYSHIARPCDLTSSSDYHLFKHGIKPMWEDEANKKGGKWIVRLRKGLASRLWENLVLAMLGEQFMVGEEICGAVVSVRFAEDIISIWNRTASDNAINIRVRDTLQRVLNLPPNTIMEYKTHTDSLKDRSSFRNTDVFMR